MPTPKRNPRVEAAYEEGAKAIQDRIAALPSLDELMARDPQTHTHKDRDALIQHFREQRALWKLKEDRKDGRKAEKEAT